ncbi:MAG: hypothetical protein KJ594_03175, partial [Candidatus Omnitrophica bacterium]|nr:hypothetical protein [Candidatus Omnitrophota bacterium]
YRRKIAISAKNHPFLVILSSSRQSCQENFGEKGLTYLKICVIFFPWWHGKNKRKIVVFPE